MRKYTCDKYNKKKGICLSDEDKENMMNEQYKKMKNLFLRQSYIDAWEDYQRSIRKKSFMMRYELEQGNVDMFADLLNRHWEISKQLDEGSTNTCIEHIFSSCEDLIDGKFIAGAGGGGFLQVILKRGVTKERLRERLLDVYQDSGVDVWNIIRYIKCFL